MARCAHKKCAREAVVGYDVGSWFKEYNVQNIAHYEVCEKHEPYFARPFDRRQSEAVKRDLTPWSPVVARVER